MNLEVLDKNIEKISEPITGDRPFEKPTLFVYGVKSNYVGEADWPMITKLFPHAVRHPLETGHWVQAEQPRAFADAVLEFLNS